MGYIKTENNANANPTKDWTAEFRKYAASSATEEVINAVATLKQAKVHETVPPSYDQLVVTSADAHRVTVSACEDSSKTRLIDSSGKSVLTPPANPRTILLFTVAYFAPKDGGWLVLSTAVAKPVQKC